MTELRPFRAGRVVLSFAGVLLAFLLIVDVAVVARQRKMLVEEMKAASSAELKLIGTLIGEALLRNDYASAGRSLVQWGEGNPVVADIRAVAPNGFVLAHYTRPEPARHPFYSTEKISLAGRHLVTLYMTKDFSRGEMQLRALVARNILYSVLVALAFGSVTWLVMRRTALVPMQEMVAEINRINEGLEARVNERTRELVSANEELEQEIAERTKAEQSLAYSEAYLRSVIENEPECVKTIDEEGVVIDMNAAGLAMLEAEREDVIGHVIYEAVAPEYVERLKAMHREVLTGKPGMMAFEVIGMKGTRRWLESRAVPFYDPRLKKNVILAVTRDITEHRRLEDQLRHAQKMEAIGTLTGGIAHEFNNILTTIIGYGEFLLNETPEADPRRKYMDIIHAQARRAARLTEGLLAYSRRQIVHFEPADLNGIIRYVENIISRLVGENIKVVLDLSGEELVAMVDKAQIEQVLMNLATNAMDAMPSGGTFSITTRKVDIDEEFAASHAFTRHGPHALITVTDTGVGMDAQTMEKIFEPFFTTKQVGKGTGLGLAMTYGIVKKHQGHISVFSEPGVGTIFSIYLPLIRHETAAGWPATPTSLAGVQTALSGTEKVLLAEDDPDVRKLIKTTLEQHGYTVEEAADGEEAVEKFRNIAGEVDLLLFDLRMPRKNGLEAYEEISSIKPGMKTLFLSGYAEDLSERLGGAFNVVAKPVAGRQLLESVRHVLDGA